MAARNQPSQRLGSTPRSAAQLRTPHVAVRLFTEHGVGATSYQMIADAVGEAMVWGVQAYSARLKDLAAQLQTAEPTNV